MRTIPSEVTCHPSGDTPACIPAYSPATPQTIVALGIGNLLWADEGFGVRCIEALQRRWEFAEHVSLIDGGTQGLYLIDSVQSATKLLIFDAIDYGLAPGTLKLIEDDDVPRFMGAKKMSLHQTGFQEVLCVAQLTGHYPEQVVLIGCQPEELDDYGGSLRPVVRHAMDEALSQGLQRLREEHEGRTVLLVSHGFVVRCLRYLIDGLSEDAFFAAARIPNGHFLTRQLP